jgi:tetratricopeptide (TPR) repeat protein
VRVDELTARLLGQRFALTPSPGGALLTGEEKDADVTRPLLGKPTPCVGREAELGSIEALFAGCVEASEARAVLVTAPPGAGKSRLRHELLRRIERRGEPMTLVAGRGDAMGAGAPYGILAAAIRALSGVGGGEPIDEQRRLLRDRVGQHVAAAERERVARFVGEMCGVPFPGEGMPVLQSARHDPKIMADCLRRAVLDWLAAQCGAGPVLVVLDDLQWGDALTVSVLDAALGEQAGSPLLVLALARPEVHEAFPRLWSGHKVQEIPLRGLSRKACERLIREVLGKDVPGAVVDRVIEQSAGNALFLEELIRSVAEGKEADRPEAVVAMLQARIGRLPAGPRRALQAASVFGQSFWDGGVAQVLGLSAGATEVAALLAALAEAELIQKSPASQLHGQDEHAFRHALVRDAAYGLLTASDIVTGHRAAGEFLDAAGEGDAAVVAEHFERGGDRERAATSYLRAAEESLERGDYAGAERLVDRGLGCGPEGEVLGRLSSVAASVGFYRNDYGAKTRDAVRRSLTLLRPGSLGWCRAIRAAAFTEREDPAHMFELLAALQSTDPEPEVLVAYIEALFSVSIIIAVVAPEPYVVAYLDRLATYVDRVRATMPAIVRYLLLARGMMATWRYPRPWSAIQDLGEAARLAQEVSDQILELSARVTTAETLWNHLGDRDGALERMLALEERLSKGQETILREIWAGNLAWILSEGPEEEAWAQAEALVAPTAASTSGMQFVQLASQGVLARLALHRGQNEKAEELTRAAIQMLPLAPRIIVGAVIVHLRALLALGRAAEACLVAEQALGVLGPGEWGFGEVELRLVVAQAFEAGGDRARARAELAEALRQVELCAADIADPRWRESYLTRNPYVARALALGREWGLPESTA